MGGADYRFICSECHLFEGEGAGSPEAVTVAVPVRDRINGTECQAIVRCELSRERHHLELIDTQDEEGRSLLLSEEEMENLHAKIEVLEKKRVCGTQGVCPRPVIEAMHHD